MVYVIERDVTGERSDKMYQEQTQVVYGNAFIFIGTGRIFLEHLFWVFDNKTA